MPRDGGGTFFTIPVRNSFGFTSRGGTVGMTGIRSRLELESSLMRITKSPLWKTDQWERNDRWNQNVRAVICHDSPPGLPHTETLASEYSHYTKHHTHMCWLNFSYGSRAIWGVYWVCEEVRAAFPVFTDDGRHIINPVTTNLSNKLRASFRSRARLERRFESYAEHRLSLSFGL